MNLLERPVIIPKGARLVVTMREERPINRKGIARLSAREILEANARAARISKRRAAILARIEALEATVAMKLGHIDLLYKTLKEMDDA
jgi:hypothetical protein